MRPLLIALAGLAAAGAAPNLALAQVPSFTASHDTAALELRLRTEQNRLEADLRAQEAQQFRFRSQLDQTQLQATTRNEAAERLSRVQPADIYAEIARMEQQRGKTDAQRRQQVDRRLRQMDR
jgi:hypothetical protein